MFGCGGGGGGSSNATLVANAGPDRNIPFHNPNPPPIALTGSASGTIVSHQWVQTSGPAVVLSGANTPTATFSLPNPLATQSYSFSYTVTDNSGNQASDSVSIYATRIIFSDSFEDASNWNFVDDTGDGFDWVANGELRQQASALAFQKSYQLGTFAWLSSALIGGTSSYRFSVDVTPLPNNIPNETEGNDVGIMLRYLDKLNYYRLSMNARSGYTRLEKRVNGDFSTLAVNAIGYVDGQAMNISAEVNGNKIIVWIDGDPVFATVDASISTGTVALYCQDKVKFDNVLITENPLQPVVAISSPLAYSVALTTDDNNNLTVNAVALNEPVGGNVTFSLDGGSEVTGIPTVNGFTQTFFGLSPGEHDLTAVIRYADGAEANADINSTVGTGGSYYIAIGDSITRGFRDNDSSNNDSADGRIVSNQGFQAPLADSRTVTTNRPQIVFNEGIGGLRAETLLDRLDSILLRHPKANRVLMMIGTNDSGIGVSSTAFRDDVTLIANRIAVLFGKKVWIAEIMPVIGDTSRNGLIEDYNAEIQRITNPGGPRFLGPDFYDGNLYGFEGRPSLYADTLHPNDSGYQVMANGWNAALPLP
jgi:lysophospholipase L1-like esterase